MSHLSCYGLTDETVAEVDFTCFQCGIPVAQFPLSSRVVGVSPARSKQSGVTADRGNCIVSLQSDLSSHSPDNRPDLSALYCYTYVNIKLQQIEDILDQLSDMVDDIR